MCNKIELSERAKTVISKLKEFDMADFEAWYLTKTVGSKHIFEYLYFKMEEEKKKKEVK